MTIFDIIRNADTAEAFICAVADLGDPETGACDDWDDTDMRHTMEVVIERARAFQGEIDHSRHVPMTGLQAAIEGLTRPDRRASAPAAVKHALEYG